MCDSGNILMTPITRADLPIIVEKYALGEFWNFAPFANGLGQTTLLLETSKGKSVLRYYNNRSAEHVHCEVQLLNFLRAAHYPVPSVIQTRCGSFIAEHKDKPCIILEFIDATPCQDPNQAFDRNEAAAVIRKVAELHRLTQTQRLAFCQNREVYDPAYCWRWFQKKHHHLLGTENAMWLKSELDHLEFPVSLPQGMCHADLNYGNFLFRDGKVVAVLDFDMSFYTYLIYDIASLIYWWAMPPEGSFRYAEARYIVNEYSKWREISVDERTHICDALKLIILLGASWSDDTEFEGEKAKVALVDLIAREDFLAS